MQWLFHLGVNVNNHYDWFLWGKWKFDLTVIDQLSINITPPLGSMNVHRRVSVFTRCGYISFY